MLSLFANADRSNNFSKNRLCPRGAKILPNTVLVSLDKISSHLHNALQTARKIYNNNILNFIILLLLLLLRIPILRPCNGGPLPEINQDVIPEGVKNVKPRVGFLCGNPGRDRVVNIAI